MNRFNYLSIALLAVACASTHQADAMLHLRRAATRLAPTLFSRSIHSRSIRPVLALPAMRVRGFSINNKNDKPTLGEFIDQYTQIRKDASKNLRKNLRENKKEHLDSFALTKTEKTFTKDISEFIEKQQGNNGCFLGTFGDHQVFVSQLIGGIANLPATKGKINLSKLSALNCNSDEKPAVILTVEKEKCPSRIRSGSFLKRILKCPKCMKNFKNTDETDAGEII